ncbi:MAG: hypothetical protein HYV09_14025 [Deltaproteobacteria bacterium]|nr:hypothetical protein [Deltaproteobacteria bacterium]
MSRVRRVLLPLAGALLVGCGSSASLEYAGPSPTFADSADETPYPETGPSADSQVADEADAAPPTPKCNPGKDGKANVCVRVLRGAEGPSITADAKTLFGLDGRGAVLVGLSAVKPGRELAFVAQTWLPTESSGAGKLAATELPKVAELAVPPGTYWAFAVFRDQEPFMRPGVAVGDYVPRFVELPQVTVTAGMGVDLDMRLYPVRAVDVELRLNTTAAGSGAGPARLWLVAEGKKIVGEGGAPCVELAGGHTELVRVFTNYTGELDVAAALFDFNSVGEDGSGLVPTFPPGTLYAEPAGNTVKVAEGEWLAPGRRVDLDKMIPIPGAKPTDPSPTCASYAVAPPK